MLQHDSIRTVRHSIQKIGWFETIFGFSKQQFAWRH
jgi:hypothetical protein